MHGFNLFEAVTGGSRFMRKRLNPNFCFILLSLQYKSKRILIGIRFRIRRDPPALPSRTQMQWDLQTSLSLDRPILETARAPKSQAKDKFFLLFLQLLLQQQLTTSFPLYQWITPLSTPLYSVWHVPSNKLFHRSFFSHNFFSSPGSVSHLSNFFLLYPRKHHRSVITDTASPKRLVHPTFSRLSHLWPSRICQTYLCLYQDVKKISCVFC